MKGRRLRRLFCLDRFGKGLEGSLDEEVRFHLQTRIDEYVRGGMSEEEAGDRALARFGDPDLVVQRCSRIDERGVRRKALSELMGDIRQDIRFALRGLTRTRGFTAVAVLSLACGIGAFVAFFTLIHATSLRPVPGVVGADQVVELLLTGRGRSVGYWDYPDFQNLRNTPTPLQAVAAWKDRSGTLTTAEGGEEVALTHVSANYFRILGVSPARGRVFLDSEDTGPGQHPVAVVGHGMWQDRLDGDPEIIGRTVTLNRTPYTIVGVAPEEFTGHLALHEDRDFWLPFMQDPWVDPSLGWTDDRESMWFQVLGKLGEGVGLTEANAALETVFARLEAEHPEHNGGRRARAYAFGSIPAAGRDQAMIAIAAGFGLLGLVLLIISGNVAGMLLARSVSREQEIAIRLALGSGRVRLARLIMVEALLVAGMGGGLGILLGGWSLDLAGAFIPNLPQVGLGEGAPIGPFALALTLAAAMAVGLLPSIRFSRPELVSSLKDDNGGGGRKAGRIHRYSASAQTGLALILLITSALFLRALDFMDQKDLGFDPAGLYSTRIDLSQQGMETPEQAAPFLDRARAALGALPGVRSVTIGDGIPLDLMGNFTGASRADQSDQAAGRIQVEFIRGDESFFETIGTPILQGRGFEALDDASSEPVIVVTERLAARLWPGEGPLGRRVRSGASREGPDEFTVIGVVPEVASSRPTESWPHVFIPFRQDFYPRVLISVRAEGDPASITRAIQSALLEIEPNLPFPLVESAESLVERGTGSQRTSARLAGALGALALLLSAIGVYGVVAFAVSSRTREIGLRMAMGATRWEILRGVVGDAVRLSVPGLGVGILLAVGVATAARSQFFGLSPVDPLSFVVAGGILLMVVILASVAPARRASGIDPMKALRME